MRALSPRHQSSEFFVVKASADRGSIGAEQIRLWTIGALCAVALHAGLIALAVASFTSDESDNDLGAPALEIGLDLASPKIEPTDLPPGPSSEASAASPDVAAQKTETKPVDLPKAPATETDDPDRLVTENQTQKTPDETPEMTTVQATASQASVASEATAPPSIDAARDQERSTAPAQGTGESRQRVRTTWQKELTAHLNKHKRYPADRAQQTAEIVIGFVLDRTGHVISTSIVKGSGDKSFDDAAVAMLRRSDPVPPPPPLVADEGLSFTVPVIFRVKGRG